MEQTYSYEFRVWKVVNRTNTDRKQVYTLCLISEEALYNEGIRVNKIQSGTPSEIVSKIVEKTWSRSKSNFCKESEGRIKFLPLKNLHLH